MAYSYTAQDVKVGRDAKDLKPLVYVCIGCVALLVVCLGLLWCKNKFTSVGYEITRTAAKRDGLLEVNKRLRLEYERMRSPQRIEKIASTELGYVYPTGSQIVSLR